MSDGFRGVFPALVTPMDLDNVDLRQLEALVEYLIAAGVHGLIPLGSTGEFYALSPPERHDVIATCVRAAAERVPVIAGVNAATTREVIQYAREAESLGASGIMVAAPFYSLPTPDELFSHIRAVDEAVGIPIMLYNYPGRTGVDIKPDLIYRMSILKNVRYIKESTGDTTRISEIHRRCGDRFTVFCGCDTVVLESFVLGAVGWVAGAANICAAEHVEIYRHLESQDYAAARELFFRLYPLFSLLENGGKYTQMVKACCNLLRRGVGWPRRPLLPPEGWEVNALLDAMSNFRHPPAS